MSVFRPLNSDESNLFTIRCVITFTSAPSGMIAGGSKLTDASAVTTDLLTTPTPNNLPDYFGIFFNAGRFFVNYGKEFTTPPCVSIMPRMKELADFANSTTAGDNPIPLVQWNNILKYENTSYPDASNYNFAFAFKDSDSGNLNLVTDVANFYGFDLIITGPVKLGVTTGNSNKGWSVGSGNDATTAYSYMDIGIGKGNPVCSLDIKGGFKTTTLKLTDTKIDGVTIQTGPAITAKDSGKLVTLAANEGSIELILPTPAAGLNYKFIIVATNSYAVTIKSSSDGTSANVTALMMGSITVNNTTTNVTTVQDELIFVANTATIGDIAEVVCDGTNWFWNATGDAAGSITLA
jgi:hypothetical protein